MSFPNLSALAVRERAVTLFFLLLSVVAGVYSFVALGRAEDPPFTIPVIAVSVVWPGATVQELQEQVVDRLEKRIQQVENLWHIDTTVRQGRADFVVTFHDYTPDSKMPELFYQVRKHMQDEAPSLPKGVIGPFTHDDFADVNFATLAVTARGMPLREMTREAEAIRDRLQRVPGVHKARIFGERPERVFVEFERGRLANLGIEPKAIFDAIEAHNGVLAAGQIDTRGPRVYLRLDADLADLDDLRAVPVRVGDRLIRLGDVAKISRGYEEPPTLMVRANGEDAILLGVTMNNGENGLQLGRHLVEFQQREQARLPLGIKLSMISNQADAITEAVNTFQTKFVVAIAVVMGVSFLALGFRAGIVVGVSIPLTLGLTFLVMKLTDVNLDRISLGALIMALGLLVDDAIIAIEMMLVKLEEGWDRVRAAGHAWNSTAAPMLFGTLVTVAGFLPVGFAKSAVGHYAGGIFWVLAYALIISWIVAVIFIPYLGVKMLPETKKFHTDSAAGSMYQTPVYRKLRSAITWCLVRRKSVVFATLGLLALSAAAMSFLVEKHFFPQSDRTEVLISIYMPQGSAIASTDSTTRKIEAILAAMPEVKTQSSYIGGSPLRFSISDTPEMPNPAYARIVAQAVNVHARDKVMATLRSHIEAGDFPEALVRIYPFSFGPPAVWPVGFRLVGTDPVVLRHIARQIRDVMRANPHTVDPHLEWDERVPVMHLNIDRERLRLLGLTPRDVAQQLQFQLDGVPVAELRQDIRSVQVRARGVKMANDSALAGIELETLDGKKVPLAQLGHIEIRFEEPVIRRYNRELFVAVLTEIQGAQSADVTASLWRDLEKIRSTLPDGYHIDIGGAEENSQTANASIAKLQPVMVISILILIMLQARSFIGMFVVAATAPLGVIGAAIFLLAFSQPFGFVALLGLIGLAGILMRNTLILTQQVADNLNAGMDAATAVVEAAVRRARPVVLAAPAAALAFVPLALDRFWGPLACTLIGGVTVGTAITLLFVPALYALWFRIRI